MPISSTSHNGVLVFVVAGFMASATVLLPSSVSAHTTTTTKKVVRTTTTKRVRTRAAYSKRISSSKVKAAPSRVAIPPESHADNSSNELVAKAKGLVGARYRWGGTSRATGFDCSGLVRHILGEKAANLPRSSSGLYSAVSKASDLRPGDLVFFGRGKAVTHVAMYVGNGQIVHASTYKTGVRVDNLNTLARALPFKGIGRII